MSEHESMHPLDLNHPVWEQCYTVAPLVLVGTREGNAYDLAPKHMVTPLGWDNYFGFVCTPRHRTYHNVMDTGVFTVSFPRADQVELVARTAAPRRKGEEKAAMEGLPTVPAQEIDGVLLEGAPLHLECRFDREVDRLGKHSLLIGRVTAARAREEILRAQSGAGLKQLPLLAYLPPDRYAAISESEAFPFPEEFEEKGAFPRTNYLQYFDTGAGSE